MRCRSRIAGGLAALMVATGCQVVTVPSSGGKSPRPAPRASTPGDAPSVAPSAPVAPVGQPPSPSAYFGRVLSPDGKPAADILVRGFLLSDQGSGLIAGQGAGLVSNNGGGLITDNGAGVLANPASRFALAQAALTTRTAADGTFALADPQGRPINIEAVASEELKAFRRGVASGAEGFDLTLAPTGAIGGLVKAEGVSDLIGVDVFIPGTGYVAKTDSQGRYTIPNVPVGTFELYATKPGLGKASAKDVAVASKQTTAVPDLVLAVARPQLTAVEPAAAGPGATVELKGANFAAAAGDVFQVTLAGAVIASPARVDGGTIRIVVPAGAESGDLVVTVGGLQGNAWPFSVLGALATPVLVRDLTVGEKLAVRAFGLDTAQQRVERPPVAWTATGAAATVDREGVVTAASAGTGEVVAVSGATRLALGFVVHQATDLVTTLAGGTLAGNADGAGGQAQLRAPTGVDFLDAKTLMFVDYGNHNVRRVDLSDPTLPVVTTVAGGPGAEPGRPFDAAPIGGFKDGAAREARFEWAYGGAADGQGGYLVADQGNHRIRRVAADGSVTTFAGTGEAGAANGPAATSTFNQPNGLARGPDGTIYVVEANSRAVRMIKDGVVSVLAGAPAQAGDTNGPGADARFRDPGSLALDGRGGLLVGEPGAHRLRRIDLVDPAHPVTAFAGSTEGLADGAGTAAKFATVGDLAVAPDGTIYLADLQGWDDGYSTRLRKITPEGQVTTLWGSTAGTAGRADGPLANARFSAVGSLAVSPDGAYLYLTDASRTSDGVFLRRLRLK